MGKKENTEGDPNVSIWSALSNRPKESKIQIAKVHMLNGVSKDFELHRGSDGEALFAAVSNDLSIKEREYFSLSFFDEEETRHWLYNDKKVLKQLKGLPWEFSYEVKFYPTEPSAMTDENARYNLFLQLKKDIASGRLPATIPTHALLSALIAQAEYGDVDASAEYERYLRDSVKVPNLKDYEQLNKLLEKVKELHKEQKGLTSSEAEVKYLDACRQLSMYGVFVFEAIDKDNGDVGIGICATGINIYKETIRVHRFPWQNIIKICYRRNNFTIKLKAGELSKKESALTYKVQDYLAAKRVWKCGVEHHTFFRLVQPDKFIQPDRSADLETVLKVATQMNPESNEFTHIVHEEVKIERVVTHMKPVIQSDEIDNIDHDTELEKALAAATQMNTDMRVEKIEARQEAHA